MSNDHDTESSRRPRKSRFQFGLSTLLLLILLAAVPIAWQRERIARWVESLLPAPLARAQPPEPFPRVLLSTTMGDITVQLNSEKAPLTVENFLRYVDEGFYTETIFHEVRLGDVIIGGGYTRDLKQKAASHPPVRNEAHNGLRNVRGAIAMVRSPSVIHGATSEFFFDLADNRDYLDPQPLERGQPPEKYGYCVFGEVISGQEVLDVIAQQEVSDNGGILAYLPKKPVVIKEAKRLKPPASNEK